MTYYFECPHCDEEQCCQVLDTDFDVPTNCHDCDEEFSEKFQDKIHDNILNKIKDFKHEE